MPKQIIYVTEFIGESYNKFFRTVIPDNSKALIIYFCQYARN